MKNSRKYHQGTKEAWTILETTYEGTKVVKTVKLQRLTSNFKEIRMEEDETFDEFYAKIPCQDHCH